MESLEGLCLKTVAPLIPSLTDQIGGAISPTPTRCCASRLVGPRPPTSAYLAPRQGVLSTNVSLDPGVPVHLLKSLQKLCSDHCRAVLHKILTSKGVGNQTIWREMCRKRFPWFFHHKFKPNLHDPLWLCHTCHRVNCDLQSKVTEDWYGIYLDKVCESKLGAVQAMSTLQGRMNHENLSKEIMSTLENPLMPGLVSVYEYCPRQLLLNMKTARALATMPKAMLKLKQSLQVLMCRVHSSSNKRGLVESTLETLLRGLLSGGRLDTLYLKEQQVTRGEVVDYAPLLALLLLGCSQRRGSCGLQGQDEKSGGVESSKEGTFHHPDAETNNHCASCELQERCGDGVSSKEAIMHHQDTETKNRHHISFGLQEQHKCSVKVASYADETGHDSDTEARNSGYSDMDDSDDDDDDDDDAEGLDDLYDFCLKEPVKSEDPTMLEELDSDWGDLSEDDPEADGEGEYSLMGPGQLIDLFCEEGGQGVNNHFTADSLDHGWHQALVGRDRCQHGDSDTGDSLYHHSIPSYPSPDPALGQSISRLVLVFIRLSPGSCTALANCLAFSKTLTSFALIQCVLPPCGWCEVLSGLCLGAGKGLLLEDLALNSMNTHGIPPRTIFGQYAAHKLNQMLQTYDRRGHTMKSLKLELILGNLPAESSYLPTYLPSIGSLTLSWWGVPQPAPQGPASDPAPIPPRRPQLVGPGALAHSLQTPGSLLTQLRLDNSSLGTADVDLILSAAAKAPGLKRVSVAGNRYSTPHPQGLLALLAHPTLLALNISQCRFSLKACEEQYQDALVKVLVKNVSLEYLNLSDPILDDDDLPTLGKAFAETHRTSQQAGYCLNICFARFSQRALEDFGNRLDQESKYLHGNGRRHSVDHLSLDWRCEGVIKTLQRVIPRVTCTHKLS